MKIKYLDTPAKAVQAIAEVFSAAAANPIVAIDLETTSLYPRKGAIRLIQICIGDTAWVFDNFKGGVVTSHLVPLLCDERISKISHNAKFEMSWFLHAARVDKWIPRNWFCTYLGSKILAAGERRPNGLGDVSRMYGDYELDKTEQKSDWSQWDLSEQQIQYAAMDVIALRSIRERMIREMAANDLLRVMAIECEAIPAVAAMELAGMHLDRRLWSNLLVEKTAIRDTVREKLLGLLQAGVTWKSKNKAKGRRPSKPKYLKRDLRDPIRAAEIAAAEAAYEQRLADWVRIPDEVVPQINMNSPKQVLSALRNLGVPLTDSTQEQWLLPFKDEFEVVDALLDYRGWEKSVTSYGESYLNGIQENDRIYPNFKQLQAETGRMASGGCEYNLNVQQVPSRGEWGLRHRECFTAPAGRKMVIADFSQIELRILAEFGADPTFCGMFNSGQDLHKATASLMFGVPIGEVTKDQRTAAKTINFGLVYGMGVTKLATQTGMIQAEAQDAIERWNTNFRGNKAWIVAASRYGIKHGHCRTASGRLVKLNFDPVDRGQVAGAGRNAVNSPIQGTSADITKTALAIFNERLTMSNLDAKLVCVVHDELVAEASEGDAEAVARMLESSMEEAGSRFIRRVSCPADALIADAWVKD